MLRLQLPAQTQRLPGLTAIVTRGTREHILFLSQRSKPLSGDALCAQALLLQRDPVSSPCCWPGMGSYSQGCTNQGTCQATAPSALCCTALRCVCTGSCSFSCRCPRKGNKMMYCTVVASRMLHPHHLQQLSQFRRIRVGL